MGTVRLRRYTNLAATLHILRKRVVTILNPASWDDRNDAYFMDQYRNQISAKSVLALCFSEAAETYHHWRVFSHGSDGVSLEFEKEDLLSAFNNDRKIKSGPVAYKRIVNIEKSPPDLEDLPFLKRLPYRDEKEFRIIYVDFNQSVDFKDYDITLECILRVNLSPWMPRPLSDAVKETIRSIDGCAKLKIVRSTLVENERWKGVADLASE